MRYFTFYEFDGENHITTIMSEDEIHAYYWDYWTTMMKKVGRDHLINKENMLQDFCTVHWATETDSTGIPSKAS